MSEFSDVLRAHAARYPLMRPRDAVKLAYQSEFGGGHILRDERAAREFLFREYREVGQKPGVELLENIGGGIARANLRALDCAGITPDELFEWFRDSARLVSGSVSGLKEKLVETELAAEDGVFGFCSEELRDYLAGYAAEGYPMVSHSDEYRRAYSPAYRVVRQR